jgi:nucleotide-binding universal stress UspA family protein
MIDSKVIKKVLAAIDGSGKSLEAADYAATIAKDRDALLIIANVLETEPWLYGKWAYEWGSSEDLSKVYQKEKEEMQKILDGTREKAEKQGVQAKTEVIMAPQTTSVAAAIVKYAEDEKVDLIVVGTRGRSGMTRMLLGSVASGVVTYAHCPVLVVK